MDKGKGNKKGTTKNANKSAKKKSTKKKSKKTAKKKKTTKNKNSKEAKADNINDKNENNRNGGESVVIEQKESINDTQNLEDKLNQPLTKKKLPPIEKNNENNEIEIEQEEMKEKGNEEIKEEIKKVELLIGTPHFYNIKGLKNNLEEKNNKINEENKDQENYKISLNSLLNDLNKILSENVELLYNDEEDEIKKKKQQYINQLQNTLFFRQQQIKESKEKNKLYKQHFELLAKRDENAKIQNTKEYEALIEEKKNDNNELNKKIIELKQRSRVGGKKLEVYSVNVKYPQDITNLTNELKTLSKKKADYFSKLNKDKKTLIICQKELENLQKVYEEHKKKNYFNAKIEEDINRLKEDLTGNEEEIYNKIENNKAFIQRKQIHQEKVNSVFKTSGINKPIDTKNMKINKGNSLEPLAHKAIRYDIKSGYNTRRYNIVAKNKSPINNRNNTKENVNNIRKKDMIEDDDLSNINYNSLSDFEYRELLTKKEHYYDVETKLEKSIKEAQKMYKKKINDIKIELEENSKKLTNRKQENEILQNDIENLRKILSLTEEEAKINNNNYDIKDIVNGNNIDEKELESHKEYLSPEYYQMNKNKKEKDKVLIPTHSNNDLTGNEILNDLKGLESNQQGVSLLEQGGHKLSNLGMKFPDLSNIEEDKGDKMINNEFDRNKAIDDIKKKYNIKKSNIEDNNDIEIDEGYLNFDEANDNKLRKEQDNTRKKEIEDRERIAKEMEDEKKFFKEHEKILKAEEEGQFEPPIENEVILSNNNNEIKVNEEFKDIINKNKKELNEEKINNNLIKSNEITEENKLLISEKKDQDQVNYKKEGEINNEQIDKEGQYINNENELEKEEFKEKDIKYEQHQDEIKIEGTENEIDKNLEDIEIKEKSNEENIKEIRVDEKENINENEDKENKNNYIQNNEIENEIDNELKENKENKVHNIGVNEEKNENNEENGFTDNQLTPNKFIKIDNNEDINEENENIKEKENNEQEGNISQLKINENEINKEEANKNEKEENNLNLENKENNEIKNEENNDIKNEENKEVKNEENNEIKIDENNNIKNEENREIINEDNKESKKEENFEQNKGNMIENIEEIKEEKNKEKEEDDNKDKKYETINEINNNEQNKEEGKKEEIKKENNKDDIDELEIEDL